MSQPYETSRSSEFGKMWTLQSGLCALCGKPMLRNRYKAPHARIWTKWRATVDHIVPKSKGGGEDAANLQLAHAQCNKIKGNGTKHRPVA